MNAKHNGCKVFDGGEAWTNWALFDASEVREIADEDLCDLAGFDVHYSGPGRSFGRRPVVRRSASRVLITQFAGMDI